MVQILDESIHHQGCADLMGLVTFYNTCSLRLSVRKLPGSYLTKSPHG